MFAFDVIGTAVQQGSKKAFAVKKGGEFTGQINVAEMAKGLRPWRKIVTAAANAAKADYPQELPMDGPLFLVLEFWMPRPTSHPKTKMTYPTKAPDLDKLIRAMGDSITDAKVWADDARVISISASEFYALPESLPVLRAMMPEAPTEPCVKTTIYEMSEVDL